MERQALERTLQARVLKALSPSRKIELAEKESREVLSLQPGYAVLYLQRKFTPRAH
jgi:hypothetical protein